MIGFKTSTPNREGRRRQLLKLACQCLGLASILLVMNYGALLGGGATVRMHVPFALGGVCMAQLADIFILSALLFVVLAPLSLTRLHAVLVLLITCAVPPFILFRLRQLMPASIEHFWVGSVFIAWCLLVLLLRWRSALWYTRLILFGDKVAIFLFVFALCSIGQILLVACWRPGPYRSDAAWERSAPPREHPRLVWVVFDELSYDPTFGHRASDLRLPNFDALREQSTLFTSVVPLSDRTVKVIPSLLSGHRVEDLRFSFSNRLTVRYADAAGWQRLDGSGTIFADARRLGWRTAAVGWFNPYCTVFGDAIQQCYAMNLDALDGNMSQLHSFAQNTVSQVDHYANRSGAIGRKNFWRSTYAPLEVGQSSSLRTERDQCTYEVRQRKRTYLDLLAHADDLLQADQADLIFLHLPVPHSPEIWKRKAASFTDNCGGSYLDGLALADRTLGEIMAELQASPRWKDTTVIVQGDHSWRTYLWRDQNDWTAEDEQAARGGFDPRPAMLIHHAGQTTGATDGSPWPLLNVNKFVEQVLRQPNR